MKIAKIELIEIRLPLVHVFETSFGQTRERRIILTKLTDHDGAEGWGECTAGESPSYCEEWTESAWTVLEQILAPTVLDKEFDSAENFWDLMTTVRGNRMAKAALETAVWDLEAKKLELPLWQHLGGTNPTIKCGVSIGIQKTPKQLLDKIETEIKAGYQRIKIKIKPGWDSAIIEKIRKKFGDILLTADANSAYTFDDIALLQLMDDFGLMMFEQPLAHDDIFDHAKLQAKLKTPICLDESIKSPADARHAIELKSCQIINIKLGRVGGHAQAREIAEIARENNIPVWCGGMLESGIGRAHNIAMSTLAGFTLPGDVSASKRYWREDIIKPEVEVAKNGTIIAPDKPGIGFEIRWGKIDALTARRVEIRK